MAKSKINIKDLIDKTTQDNTNIIGQIEKDILKTTEFIRLKSWSDIENISFDERKKTATDFAIINSCKQNSRITEDNIRFSPYWLRSCSHNSGTEYVDSDGKVYWCQINNLSIGVAPSLSFNLKKILNLGEEDKTAIKIISKTGKTNVLKHYVFLGEYPKTIVDTELNEELERQFNEGNLSNKLKPTGALYSTNCPQFSQTQFLMKKVPEFEYFGNKYVRTNIWRDSSFNTYADGSIVQKSDEVQWLKVEPIEFEITNWQKIKQYLNCDKSICPDDISIDLESEQVIISGIPFTPVYDMYNCSMWQNSLIRCFLNSTKTEDLDKCNAFEVEHKWNFNNEGFLQEAFNLNKQPIHEYYVSSSEAEIGKGAFCGCVNLNYVEIPKSISRIGDNAFAFMGRNTTIKFEAGKNLLMHNAQQIFNGTDFKNIYVAKNFKSIFISTEDLENLSKKCFKLDFNITNLKKIFNANFRENYIILNRLKSDEKIKFIPPTFTLKTFPSSQIANYFINNNHHRWGNLVQLSKLNDLPNNEKTNALIDLMKVYYALGGFSEKQKESEVAFDYVLNHIISPGKYFLPRTLALDLHERFSRLEIQEHHSPEFAHFFMKYYHNNPDFMKLSIRDKYGYLLEPKDFLCQAHNNFTRILKTYPNKMINTNDKRSLLSPQFVAQHINIVKYENVKVGNEELADTVGAFGYTQQQFEKMQTIIQKSREIKNNLIIKCNEQDLQNPITFRLLEKDDPLGFVIGDITNCCQVIGGTANDCVVDGFTNNEAGFIVFEAQKDGNSEALTESEIVAQAYVWYDPITKTVCLDNIEIPKLILEKLKTKNLDYNILDFINALERCSNSIINEMNKNELKVVRVTTGEGYNDLKHTLIKRYPREYMPNSKHRNYCGYTDADRAQYVIKDISKSKNTQHPKSPNKTKQNLDLKYLLKEIELTK